METPKQFRHFQVPSVVHTLIAEMRSRVKEDDASVPVFQEGYYYYSRFETGKQYPIYARKKGSVDVAEQKIVYPMLAWDQR